MTLVIVDQFRMTADSYVHIEDDAGERWERDFPKLFALPGHVVYQGEQSFTSVACVGDALSFQAFLHRLLDHLQEHQTITSGELAVLARDVEGSRAMAVIPFDNAALTVSFAGGEEVDINYDEGAVLGYGGAYRPERDSNLTEYRAWFSIFIDAQRAGELPGPDIHFLPHSREISDRDAVQDVVEIKPHKPRKRCRLFSRAAH